MELSHKASKSENFQRNRNFNKAKRVFVEKYALNIILCYCSTTHRLWTSNLGTPTNLKRIKKNLQKAVRKIIFKSRNQPTEPLFNDLRILDFEKHLTTCTFNNL